MSVSRDPRLAGRAVGRVVYTEDAIQRRVGELGAEIANDHPDGDLLVLGLLKGSFIFVSDLVRAITRPLQVDFLIASSYADGTKSSGRVDLLYSPSMEIDGRHVLLVEDIVDSGLTLERTLEILARRRPRSLEVCALLHKRVAGALRFPTRYVGFDAPNEFLVGYGLDHAEDFRHLPYVASLADS